MSSPHICRCSASLDMHIYISRYLCSGLLIQDDAARGIFTPLCRSRQVPRNARLAVVSLKASRPFLLGYQRQLSPPSRPLGTSIYPCSAWPTCTIRSLLSLLHVYSPLSLAQMSPYTASLALPPPPPSSQPEPAPRPPPRQHS